MIIEQITCTPFQQNTRIVGCPETRKAICIDPGEMDERIIVALEKHKLELQAITLTHGHMDHVGGTPALKKRFPNAEVIIHEADLFLYAGLQKQPLMLGISQGQLAALGFDYDEPPPVEKYWQDSEIYEVGNLSFNILHCPGHTPGHVVMFEANEKTVFVGDCLFAGSIGRTDLPGGNGEQLMNSLMNKIMKLGDDVEVHSGHGPVTNIGQERLTNPFLTGVFSLGRGTRFI